MELYKSKYFDRKKSERNPDRNKKPFRSFRNSRDDKSSRYPRDEKRGDSTTVTCADCGVKCQVPFVPRSNKPVFCSDCFRENKPHDSGNDRYPRDEKRGESTTVTCADCGVKCQVPFVPRTNKPVFCSDCFRENKPHDSGNDRYPRDEKRGDSTTVTCTDCGVECQVPFVPRTNKPVFCSDCFRENKPHDSGNDRYPSGDRGSRRDNSRPKRSNNDKFLKKQLSLFSDGSEKFYASLKEKLFEILGGKVCSSCGFKDERALGFSHKYDGEAFDSIGRGGVASSWGKYISEPKLAREELDVLCLNCNKIKQPISKPKDKSKFKKNRRFPR